jgi:hypothetical protein
MRKLPAPWSVISTDNVCWAITTSAPMVLFIALMIKLTGTIPGRRGEPDTPVNPEVANTVLERQLRLPALVEDACVQRGYADPGAGGSGESEACHRACLARGHEPGSGPQRRAPRLAGQSTLGPEVEGTARRAP